MNPRMLVTVVDDDESVRESLPVLVRMMGYEVQVFSSASAFLLSDSASRSRCLILDINMPGMSGPALSNELKESGIHLPTIFITANQEDGAHVQMVKDGAVACLYKPFSDSELSDALAAAVKVHENATVDWRSS